MMNIFSAISYTMTSLIICFECETEYPNFNISELYAEYNHYVNVYLHYESVK